MHDFISTKPSAPQAVFNQHLLEEKRALINRCDTKTNRMVIGVILVILIIGAAALCH